MWEGAGFHVEAESPRIIAQLKQSVEKLSPLSPSSLAIDDEALRQDLGIQISWRSWLPTPYLSWYNARLCVYGFAFWILWHLRAHLPAVPSPFSTILMSNPAPEATEPVDGDDWQEVNHEN